MQAYSIAVCTAAASALFLGAAEDAPVDVESTDADSRARARVLDNP